MLVDDFRGGKAVINIKHLQNHFTLCEMKYFIARIKRRLFLCQNLLEVCPNYAIENMYNIHDDISSPTIKVTPWALIAPPPQLKLYM